jgi:hypothetical protein
MCKVKGKDYRPCWPGHSNRGRTARTALILTAILLTACSSASTNAVPLQTFDQNAGAVSLPPTWTPTSSPTASPARPTSTPLASIDEEPSTPSAWHAESGATRTPRPLPSLPTLQRVTSAPVGSNDAGWQRVETRLAEFMLPGSYQVIDLGSGFSDFFGAFAQGFVEGMGEFAGEIAGEMGLTPTPLVVEDLDQAFTFDFLLALEEDLQTSVVLVSEPMETPPELEESMRASLGSMEGDLKILGWQLIEDRTVPTGRILVEATVPESGETGRALIFVFLSPTQRWNLIYQTSAELFPSELATFEQSAASFRIK